MNAVLLWFKGLLSYVLPLLKAAASSGGRVLFDIVSDAVEKAQENGGSGDEKRDYARKYALREFRTNGLKEIGDSLLNALIENAVIALKGSGK